MQEDNIIHLNIEYLPEDEYESDPEDEENLTIDEEYVEPVQVILKGNRLSAAELKSHIEAAEVMSRDGDFVTIEGEHWIYTTADKKLEMVGYIDLGAACKHFNPALLQIESFGAKLTKDYKYDRAFASAPCCSSKSVESVFCISQNNHISCFGYEPEDLEVLHLATDDSGVEIKMIAGRMLDGIAYTRIIDGNDTILAAVAGDDLSAINKSWEELVIERNLSEQIPQNTNPKNPYLESLLI